MMDIKHAFLLLIYFFSVGFNAQKKKITLLNKQKNYSVKDTITLQFNVNNKHKYQLYCSNSYGSTVIKPVSDKETVLFQIPKYISSKRGILHWALLINGNTTLKDNITIRPLKNSTKLEMYLGPPSIEAGKTDFSMLVAIPTDSLDNPLQDGTKFKLQKQFKDSKQSQPLTIENLLGFKKIYATKQSGRMLISTTHVKQNSTEYSLNIVPAAPKNFKIFAKRNHKYSDGNQITTFYTSIIKDKFNNVVSDGTLVYFYIKDNKNNILKTLGQTVNGIAQAKILHPDSPTKWKINAFVEGIANSNTISLQYDQVIKDYKVKFSDNNSTIKVGPLQSFMKQMIPDGLLVTLNVLQKDKVIKTYKLESRNGYVIFNINKDFYKKRNYSLRIEAAGVVKIFKNVLL